MKVTEVAQPGKPRQIQAFELRMNIIADATIDLLFTKNRVTFSLIFLSFFFLLCVCVASPVICVSFHILSVIFRPVPAALLVFVLVTHPV